MTDTAAPIAPNPLPGDRRHYRNVREITRSEASTMLEAEGWPLEQADRMADRYAATGTPFEFGHAVYAVKPDELAEAWTFELGVDPEIWSCGPRFASRADAEAAALAALEASQDGAGAATVGRMVPLRLATLTDTTSLLDRIAFEVGDAAYDEIGEAADGFPTWRDDDEATAIVRTALEQLDTLVEARKYRIEDAFVVRAGGAIEDRDAVDELEAEAHAEAAIEAEIRKIKDRG